MVDALGTLMAQETSAGTVPTERSYPPPDGMDTLVDPDRFDDFGRLTGE